MTALRDHLADLRAGYSAGLGAPLAGINAALAAAQRSPPAREAGAGPSHLRARRPTAHGTILPCELGLHIPTLAGMLGETPQPAPIVRLLFGPLPG